MLRTSVEVHHGKRLRVARMGNGPPLVCLHGYPDNLQIWSELAPALSASYEVIAFDWPGMGQSEPWPGGATPEHMADRLLALLDDWGLSRASLMGIDMGGQPALAFAAKNSDRTACLVVMNSLVIPDEQTSWEIAVLRKFGWNRFLLRRFPRAVFRRALRTFQPSGYQLNAELRADFWNAFRTPEVRGFISKMSAGYQGRLEQLAKSYPQIEAPTLILWAEQDGHFPPTHARRLHQQLRRSELCIVPETRHWMPLHLAGQLARIISSFLGRHTRSL
jgi:pimeloyl-ACP methyl ester carboxylesterase